jgi:hypothetical protein
VLLPFRFVRIDTSAHGVKYDAVHNELSGSDRPLSACVM